MEIMGIGSVAAISIICFIFGLAWKTSPLPDKWIPLLCGVIGGGLGYRNGYYISGGSESANAADCVTGCIPYEIISGGTQPTDVLYIKGYTGAANASHTRMNLRKTDKTHGAEYNGFLSGAAVFDVEVLGTGYYKLTPKTGLNHSFNYDVGYLRFSFAGTDGANIVITKNEPIE